MFATYEESVIDAADDNGNLSYKDAQRLLGEHDSSIEDTYADNHGVCPVALDERNAEALLNWLGYWAPLLPLEEPLQLCFHTP